MLIPPCYPCAKEGIVLVVPDRVSACPSTQKLKYTNQKLMQLGRNVVRFGDISPLL